MENLSKNKILLFAILSVMVMFVFVSTQPSQKKVAQKEEPKLIEVKKNDDTNLQKIKFELDNTPVLAKAIYAYDITDDVLLYGKNENEILPIASLAKIFSALIVKKYNENTEITLKQEDLNQIGNNALNNGETFNKEDLLAFALVVSSNDAMHALTKDEQFVEDLNNYVRDIGLSNTHFLNSTGLDESQNFGAESTAKEVSSISIRAWKLYPELFAKTTQKSISITSKDDVVHEVPNTNLIVEKIPNLLFSKTGYTKKSGGSLSIIFKNQEGHDISVVLLGSTQDGRFSDMESIVQILYNTTDETTNNILEN